VELFRILIVDGNASTHAASFDFMIALLSVPGASLFLQESNPLSAASRLPAQLSIAKATPSAAA
jgi:hypothetical protein